MRGPYHESGSGTVGISGAAGLAEKLRGVGDKRVGCFLVRFDMAVV